MVATAPQKIRTYVLFLEQQRLSLSTQTYYVAQAIQFFQYVQETQAASSSSLSVSLLSAITEEDLKAYAAYLTEEKRYAISSVRKTLSALSSLFRYLRQTGILTQNPFDLLEFPKETAAKDRTFLTLPQIRTLLSGVLSNRRYYAQTEDGVYRSLPIPETVWLKRERLVKRNYAILCCFIGTGIQTSELVGLNLEDLNFRMQKMTIRTEKEIREIGFGSLVGHALQEYVTRPALPSGMADKYLFTKEEVITWCKEHVGVQQFDSCVRKEFPKEPETLYQDMKKMTDAFRRCGRSGLSNAKNNHALFISERGRRMSVRMTEVMVKEMLRTYLPELAQKTDLTPNLLRNSYAKQMLRQYGYTD